MGNKTSLNTSRRGKQNIKTTSGRQQDIEPNKQITNKQASKQAHKQTNKQTNKQTTNQSNKQTNKPHTR